MEAVVLEIIIRNFTNITRNKYAEGLDRKSVV